MLAFWLVWFCMILSWSEVGRHMPLPQDKVHECLVLPFFSLEKGCRCPHNKSKSNHKCMNASNTIFPTKTVVLVGIHISYTKSYISHKFCGTHEFPVSSNRNMLQVARSKPGLFCLRLLKGIFALILLTISLDILCKIKANLCLLIIQKTFFFLHIILSTTL